MFVSKWLFIFICSFGCLGVLFLCFIIYSCIQVYKEKMRLKEQRLLKMEEDIRYLKGIGGVEND